jgi:hypothetical protein
VPRPSSRRQCASTCPSCRRQTTKLPQCRRPPPNPNPIPDPSHSGLGFSSLHNLAVDFVATRRLCLYWIPSAAFLQQCQCQIPFRRLRLRRDHPAALHPILIIVPPHATGARPHTLPLPHSSAFLLRFFFAWLELPFLFLHPLHLRLSLF